jgi:hypothetical protein
MSTVVMKDRLGQSLEVVGLVIARITQLDTVAGTVYPYGYDDRGNVVIIDSSNELCETAPWDYTFFNPSAAWVEVTIDTPRARFYRGDVVQREGSLPRKNINTGCAWCRNRDGAWIALNKKHLKKITPHYSAAAFTYRLMAAQADARPGGIVEMLTPTALSVGYSIDFKPAELEKHVVVKVEFTPGGKLYTYRLKDGMIAEAGDDAVVVVNNPDYPELKGTKVVRIKEVTTIDSIPGNYKYVEHVVSNRSYREVEFQIQRSKAYAAALKLLEKKSAELEQVKARATRLELEIAKMAEDVAAGKY